MEGLAPLVSLRRHGVVPSNGVLIHVSDTPRGPWVSQAEVDGELHVLNVAPSENIDRLDLRCVIGLKVLVLSGTALEDPHEQAVRDLGAACAAAGAKRVIGIVRSDSTPLDDVPVSSYVVDFTRAP